jgi:hypothetical protein
MRISSFAKRAIRAASVRYADAKTWGAQTDSYESLRDMIAVAIGLPDSTTADCTVLDVLGLSEDEYGNPDAVLAAIDDVSAHELEEAGF